MRPDLAATVLLLVASAAPAVIIDSGDGTGNATAPASDPGWDHVGTPGNATAIHLGDGWIISARHVAVGDMELGGTTYPYVPGSEVQFQNKDLTIPDLRLFQIYPFPPQPQLPIAAASPGIGEELILIGRGRNRGPATRWMSVNGYLWDPGNPMRWGTNQVEDEEAGRIDLGVHSSEAFSTFFDAGTDDDESQGATGDSGGAVFVQNGSGWDLAGVIFSIGTFMGQPPSTALYGNKTSAVDLAFYRDDILDATAVPEPSGGLAAGLALLLGLGRRRGARAEGRTPRGHGLWPRLERQSRPQRRRRRAYGDEGARRGASAFPPLAQV